MEKHKNYCSYYQAVLKRNRIWFVVGVLRNEDHVVFERACEGNTSTFEFFVPTGQEQRFLDVMKTFQESGEVSQLEKLPNRFS